MADIGISPASSYADRQATSLWRSFRTVFEMLADRGYEITDEELKLPLDEFRQRYSDVHGFTDRSKMTITARPSKTMIDKYTPLSAAAETSPLPDCGTIYVEYCSSDQGVGAKQVREFLHRVDEQNFHSGIFITNTPISTSAGNLLNSIPGRYCQHFLESELVINITHHELVPKHVLLSPAEKKQLLDRYRLKQSQLPRIQIGDPVSRYLGLRRAQVVKIVRRSETAGRYATYRLAN